MVNIEYAALLYVHAYKGGKGAGKVKGIIHLLNETIGADDEGGYAR